MKPIEKPIEKWTFDELVEWASGYLLQQLLIGKFKSACFTVCDCNQKGK